MKVLKLDLYQESACYKKPFAFKVTETYPLPPYSTVIGMIHNLIKAEQYIPMEVSIQGDYESIFNSYNTMRFYKSNEITTMPLNIHMLYGINLIVHVNAEEEILNRIVNGFKTFDEHLSLGRREDLLRINAVNFTKVREIDVDNLEDNIIINRPIYIPEKYINFRCSGIKYRLNYKYKLKNNLRIWEKIDVKYVEKGQEIDDGKVYLDSDNDLVYLAKAGV